MKSKILIGTSENVRFAIVDTTNIVKKAIENSIYDEMLSISEIALLNIASVMSSNLKGDNTKFNIVLKADGLLGNAKVRVKSDGEIISNLDIDSQKLDELNNSKTFEEFNKRYKIGKGKILFQQDLGLKNPYYTELTINEEDTLEEIFQKYYDNSEQVKSIIKTGVKFNKDNKIQNSGAIILQALPNADLEKFDLLSKKINMIYGIQELLAHNFSLEDVVRLIFEDVRDDKSNLIEEYKILEIRDLTFECDCSDSYFKQLLKSTCTKDEIQDMIAKNGYIETVCGFCKAVYIFKEVE